MRPSLMLLATETLLSLAVSATYEFPFPSPFPLLPLSPLLSGPQPISSQLAPSLFIAPPPPLPTYFLTSLLPFSSLDTLQHPLPHLLFLTLFAKQTTTVLHPPFPLSPLLPLSPPHYVGVLNLSSTSLNSLISSLSTPILQRDTDVDVLVALIQCVARRESTLPHIQCPTKYKEKSANKKLRLRDAIGCAARTSVVLNCGRDVRMPRHRN